MTRFYRPTPIKQARRIVASAIAGKPEYADLRRPILRGELDDSDMVQTALRALRIADGNRAKASEIFANVLPALEWPDVPVQPRRGLLSRIFGWRKK